MIKYALISDKQRTITPSPTTSSQVGESSVRKPKKNRENINKNKHSRRGSRNGVWPLVIGTLYFIFQWWAVVTAVDVLARKDVVLNESAE